MLTLIQRIALLTLLAVFSLQGLAAVTVPMMCLATGDHHHAEAGTVDHGHNDSHEHQHGSGDDGSTGDVAGHLDCHHVFSGAPVSAIQVGAPDLPILQTTISSAATLYIPELPQRPPRT